MNMHPYHRAADINPCNGLHPDRFCKNRLSHPLIADCGKCTPCMVRVGNRIYLLESIFLKSLFLNHKSPVQMLTALAGQVDTSV